MIKIEIKENCSGCYACENSCPKDCIQMVEDAEGFLYPKVDTTTCVQCGNCEKACPILTTEKKEKTFPTAFAAINKDERIREKSSSGGVFSALAEYVLEKGGAVFGAVFNEKFEVVHKCVTSKNELASLRGSKYVQSRIGNTFRQAKELLKDGKIVLFTGTPCQIAGLLKYLGKDYENLYTQDLICHGVPSPFAWKKYLKDRENLGRVEEVSFRDKSSGWKTFSLSIKTAKEKQVCDLNSDLYMRLFLKNLSLRRSCYQCHFKGNARVADITIGDFWGVEIVFPEVDDNKGISLVYFNTEKGEKLLRSVADKITCLPVSYENAVKYNVAAESSVRSQGSRELFFRKLKKLPFDRCAELFLEEKHKKRIQFWEDKESVRKEKGKFFAFLWAIKNKKNYK